MEKRKLNAAIVASGSGTDADVVMEKFDQGFFPELESLILISTNCQAGCLEKAKARGINHCNFDFEGVARSVNFGKVFSEFLVSNRIDIVFLLGCVLKVQPVEGVKIYNIHPADLEKHGGNKCYGLEVHRRVILEKIDQIERGRLGFSGPSYTYPTFHSVDEDYDSGPWIMQAQVKIPYNIIAQFYFSNRTRKDLDQAAEELQKHVLRYEWKMLPSAVSLAILDCLDESRERFKCVSEDE
ncbi:MAG: formyltransferase family protein [Candidatus Moranbacteria bacterium]|nr:formyltransferase family protein [Candidatus Moranbacteria bacterium]